MQGDITDPQILLKDISVNYPLLNPIDFNLKRKLLNIARRKREDMVLIRALSNVSLTLKAGDKLAILGRNGAGKSTLLQVLAGVLPPTHGKYFLRGRVLGLLGGAEMGLDAEASGRRNIITLGISLGESIERMESLTDEIIDFSELGNRIDDPVYTYSSGMAARLRFSTLTSLNPNILIVDEGIGAADAAFAKKAEERLENFMGNAGILIMASHNTSFLRQFCNRGLVLFKGKVASDSSLDESIAIYKEISARIT
jgi:ABC-type polysaccharide/polyol phosphate transport system ATPase subunit